MNFQTSQKNKKMKSNFVDNTKMDLSFDGSMLDESICSSFNGGALEDGDFNGGDTFAFEGNTKLDLSFSGFNFTPEQIKTINEAKSVEEEYKKLNSKDRAAVSFEDYYKYKMYKKSGGKKDYKDWYKTERLKSTATNVLQTLGQFSDVYLQQKGYNTSKENTLEKTTDFENKDYSKKDDTILGLHPVTFGVISIVVAAVGIGAVIYFNKK